MKNIALLIVFVSLITSLLASGNTDELREIYNRFAEKYDENREIFDMSKIIFDFNKYSGIQKGRLLDLGCGAGSMFTEYYLSKGWEILGVDLSEKMLELSQKNYPQMKTIIGDMTEIDFDNDSFDVIISVYSLFHIQKEKHEALFQNIYKWLTPNGKVLFTYAGVEYTGSETFSGYIEFMGENMFYSHLSQDELLMTLEKLNFKNIDIKKRDIGGETFLWVSMTK